ncbi:Med5-domain-containing protein [Cystobasidium minutum MCA 4210]|uniref:Med5-domain-containing protein n=1 Tax=Cystobasidium minutum MCA 4210 TaxID=1397322 RepID=UPI0034CDB972|eukprot:jgi/Rhomi1/5289/CE5288_621
MELWGGILLALRTLVWRHSLQDTFSKFGLGVVSAMTASSATLSKPASLHALTEQHRKVVSAWISALYGSEGIEDDLIRSTSPQVMLAIAPTIVHQSMIAMENGVIDQETLLNGLSYFCQDFLTFALPSIVSYLASRPQPNLQIINSLLASESTPACVLELVQDDLRIALTKLDPTSEDVKTLSKRLKGGPKLLPLSRSSLGAALATGTDVVPNLRAAYKTRDCSSVMYNLVNQQDSFMASLAISQSDPSHVADNVKSMLTYAVQKNYGAAEEEVYVEMDRLADSTALTFIRLGKHLEQEEVSRYPLAFRERFETWFVE